MRNRSHMGIPLRDSPGTPAIQLAKAGRPRCSTKGQFTSPHAPPQTHPSRLQETFLSGPESCVSGHLGTFPPLLCLKPKCYLNRQPFTFATCRDLGQGGTPSPLPGSPTACTPDLANDLCVWGGNSPLLEKRFREHFGISWFLNRFYFALQLKGQTPDKRAMTIKINNTIKHNCSNQQSSLYQHRFCIRRSQEGSRCETHWHPGQMDTCGKKSWDPQRKARPLESSRGQPC